SVPRNASPASSGFPWRRLRRWLLRGGLLLLGLALGIGIPVFWKLDKQVRSEFEQLSWQVPTRVYARPLPLQAGQPPDAASLELELAAAGYRPQRGDLPGTYARHGKASRSPSPAFTVPDGPAAARKLEVVLAGNRISRVLERGSGKPVEGARLDPARIATLYGNAREERRLVKLEDVPSLLVTGLQAVEDRNFKHHHGLDWWG